MKTFTWITMLVLLMAGGVLSPSQADVLFQPAGAEAAKPTAAPQAGQALAINLGDGEFLPLVWIGPLKIWVGKFEVTNGQYRRFDMDHESRAYYGHLLNAPDQPVVLVSWEDADNYCAWLNRACARQIPDGYVCRLPTEKEWQTFASCGGGRRYPWGNTWPPPDNYNYRGEEGTGLLYRLFQSEPSIEGHDDGFITTCPVKHSGYNAWGLFGVGGNVWEWCRDWSDAKQITRSLRGAGWNNTEPDILAVTNRSDAHPLRSNPMIGFRVVVAPAE